MLEPGTLRPELDDVFDPIVTEINSDRGPSIVAADTRRQVRRNPWGRRSPRVPIDRRYSQPHGLPIEKLPRLLCGHRPRISGAVPLRRTVALPVLETGFRESGYTMHVEHIRLAEVWKSHPCDPQRHRRGVGGGHFQRYNTMSTLPGGHPVDLGLGRTFLQLGKFRIPGIWQRRCDIITSRSTAAFLRLEILVERASVRGRFARRTHHRSSSPWRNPASLRKRRRRPGFDTGREDWC